MESKKSSGPIIEATQTQLPNNKLKLHLLLIKLKSWSDLSQESSHLISFTRDQ